MNNLGKRLDGLAASATRGVRVLDPSGAANTATASPFRKRSLLIGIAAVIAIGAMLAVWQRGESSPTSVIAAQGEDQQARCAIEPVIKLLQSGLPTYDYEPAGSYLQLANRTTDLVTGRVVSAQRTVLNGRGFVELTLGDVVDIHTQAPRPDVDVIAYDAVWADRSSVDPLAQAVAFNAVQFVGFLTPWSGVRGGWTPGVEGLYVACGDDTLASAVVADARGPADARALTLSQLIELVREPLVADTDEAQRLADEAARLAEKEAQLVESIQLSQARELWQAADIQDYRLRYSLLGPEGSAASVRVSVMAGEISTFESYAGDSDPVDDARSIVYTVEELFDLIAGADLVREVDFELERGFPTLISLDPDDALAGDELRIDNVEFLSQSELDDIETAITAWLPPPTSLPGGLDIDHVAAAGKAFLLHDEPEMDVWLYRTERDICVTVAHKTGLASGSPAYAGTNSACAEDTQFATLPTWLTSSGGVVQRPYALLVPPISYLDETWATEVVSPRQNRLAVTERSVLVIFDEEGPAGGASVEIRCGCGDLSTVVQLG